MIWVGLDLHKKYITACALEEAGVMVAEHRRLPADAEALISWLTGLGRPVTVAMGTTLYWAWLHDQLSAAGLAAVAAHPYQVKLIWHAQAKTDPIDARKLADLLRTNLLPVVWVPSPKIRARRKLLRGRAYLVRLRTSVKNRIHGHLTAENCRTEVTDRYGKAGRARPATVALSAMGRIQVDLLLEMVEQLDLRIKRLDRRVQRLVKEDPVAQHPKLGWEDDPRRGRAVGQPVAPMDPDRNRRAPETGARPGPGALSPPAPVAGQSQGDGGGGPEAELLPLLVCAGRMERRAVAPSARHAGGAPEASAGYRCVAGSAPENTSGPPPSNDAPGPRRPSRRLEPASCRAWIRGSCWHMRWVQIRAAPRLAGARVPIDNRAFRGALAAGGADGLGTRAVASQRGGDRN